MIFVFLSDLQFTGSIDVFTRGPRCRLFHHFLINNNFFVIGLLSALTVLAESIKYVSFIMIIFGLMGMYIQSSV